jgi:hypothetical protein
LGKIDEILQVNRGERFGRQLADKNRIASVAASPASIQPLNAVTIVGTSVGGSR